MEVENPTFYHGSGLEARTVQKIQIIIQYCRVQPPNKKYRSHDYREVEYGKSNEYFVHFVIKKEKEKRIHH